PYSRRSIAAAIPASGRSSATAGTARTSARSGASEGRNMGDSSGVRRRKGRSRRPGDRNSGEWYRHRMPLGRSPAPLLALLLVAGCAVVAPAGEPVHVVRVRPPTRITLDGVLSEPEWIESDAVTGFRSPWDAAPTPVPETLFRSFRDDAFWYFAFMVE